MTQDPHTLPTWAPRVRPDRVRQLYQLDAQGIYDDELIDDVGYGLLARCKSFIQAVAATQGRATCPNCGAVVEHRVDKTEMLRCHCGWSLSWSDYFATIQRQQLSGAEPVLARFRAFMERFPKASTPQARMILIDSLLHAFHWYLKTGEPTRPVAVNLIALRLWEVIAFLEELTYGHLSTTGLRDKKAEWDERIRHAKSWRRV